MSEPALTRVKRSRSDAPDAIDAIFRPVRVGNAFEECVERLLTAIKLGLVGDGDRLPAERDLAARFDVSRTTLREAIRELQTSGYVESRRGRTGGTFVTWEPPSNPNRLTCSVPSTRAVAVSDTALLRDALEVGAASAAASKPVHGALRRHLLACLGKVVVADLAAFRRADSRLHLAIAEVTGSSSLVAAVADARMRVNDLLDTIPLMLRGVHQSNEQHRAIVGAIVARDPEAARDAMSDHLAGTTALLRAFLD